MQYRAHNMPGVQGQMVSYIAGNENGAGGTAVEVPATNSLESGQSRPPTPRGSGLPENFGQVVSGIYRSSYPLPVHLSSIAALNLKTVITLVEEQLSAEYLEMMELNEVSYHVIPVIPNKTPGVSSPQHVIDKILEILFEPKNHPVLVHCNKGKHRTGCVMACFRRLQEWDLSSAIAEYLRYAHPKPRQLDQVFIENYNVSILAGLAEKVGAWKWKPDFLGLGVLKVITANGDDAQETVLPDGIVPSPTPPSESEASLPTEQQGHVT